MDIMDPCPIASSLLEELELPLPAGTGCNLTTIMKRAEMTQAWLSEVYLGRWLQIIGELPGLQFEEAQLHPIPLRALGNHAADLREHRAYADQVFLIGGIERQIRMIASRVRRHHAPRERSFEWGMWARGVAAAARDGFLSTDFLNPDMCAQLAPTVMYAAYLVSEIVDDDESADEIEDEMFVRLPQRLIEQLLGMPSAPDA
jgi:hypothetical protein